MASDSRCKGSNAPSLKSPAVDQERTRSVGDFSGFDQCWEFPWVLGTVGLVSGKVLSLWDTCATYSDGSLPEQVKEEHRGRTGWCTFTCKLADNTEL